MERPIISVDFCDLGRRETKTEHWLYKILQERFEVRLTTSPDFVFYGDGGDVHKMYTCTRIYVGHREPDFGVCDCAVLVGGNGKSKMEDRKAAEDRRVVTIGNAVGMTAAEKDEVLRFLTNVFLRKAEPVGAKKSIFGRWVLVKKNA